MQENNSIMEIIKIFIKWKKLILSTTIAALVISIIISLLLPNYYKSSEIFYPYNLESLDPKNLVSEKAADVFGTSNDLERLRQIGMSAELVGKMVYKYDLFKRYKIDTTSITARESVVKQFEKNYSIIKNDMGALEVSIYDENPEVAAQMASEVVHFIDSLNKKPLIEHNKRLYDILSQTIDDELSELSMLDKKVKNSEVTEEQNKANLSLKSIIEAGQANDIDNKIADRLIYTLNLKTKASQVKKFLSGDFTTVFIITKAAPALKKSRPVRWLIVTVSTFITFFLTLLAAVLIEYYQTNLREIIQNAK